jgi:hypothetical protein
MNMEDWENKYKDLQPWPEVAYLFGEDENYQDMVLDIMSNITLSITNISNYMKVILYLCFKFYQTIILNFEYKNRIIKYFVKWLNQQLN